MRANLIAYVPTINQRHLDWFARNPRSNLHLIPQGMAEELLPRLNRNMAAVPTDIAVDMVRATHKVFSARLFEPGFFSGEEKIILADEDVSHLLAERYFTPRGVKCVYEEIWARWDMQAVQKAHLVVPDVVVSTSELDVFRMTTLDRIARKSPDWWRQIAAGAWMDDRCLASAFNTHMPNEYETYIFGDPRINVDAGQPGKYVSLHSERGVIARCARKGIRLEGASFYVSTFPCEDCAREIREAGVSKLFYRDGYSTLNAQDVLRSEGIEIVQVQKEPAAA